MVIAVGFGFGSLFQKIPTLHSVLKIIGTAYLIYLAYKIATAQANNNETKKIKPLSIGQAALFQLVNPKAWVMAIGAIATYSIISDHYSVQVLIIALIFLIFGTPCTGIWLWFGSSLKEMLAKPHHLRIFNLLMAALLLSSLLPVFHELYINVTS